MTNEEAYRWLYVHFAPCGDETKQDEAVNVALKALKAQSKHEQNTMQNQPDLETLGVKTGKTCADAISRQDAIDAILADKIDAISLKVMTALGDGRLALTLNDACDRHIRDIKSLQSVHPERKWNRLMMYLSDLQITYSPSCGAKGDGDEKIYDFVTELIEELEGWGELDAND